MKSDSSHDTDIVQRLQFMARDGAMVPYTDCVSLIKESSEITIPADKLAEIHKFACIQCGRWEAEWGFSLVSVPNTRAEKECEGWELLCNGIFDAIEKAHPQPDLLAILQKERRLHALKATLDRNLEYGRGKPLEHFVMRISCRLGKFLENMGLHTLGRKLCVLGFYPKGTVGRA